MFSGKSNCVPGKLMCECERRNVCQVELGCVENNGEGKKGNVRFLRR